MRQEQRQQESGTNERETPAATVLPGWRDRSGESEKGGGARADIEKLSVGLLGPWLDWGQQTWMPSIKRLTLPAVCPLTGTPIPGEQQKSLPEHAGPTRQAAEARASQGSQKEPVSRQNKSPGLFYHSEQEHSPPSSHPEQELGPGKDYPPTREALTVAGIGLVPVLQDGSVQLLTGTAHTFTLPRRA